MYMIYQIKIPLVLRLLAGIGQSLLSFFFYSPFGWTCLSLKCLYSFRRLVYWLFVAWYRRFGKKPDKLKTTNFPGGAVEKTATVKNMITAIFSILGCRNCKRIPISSYIQIELVQFSTYLRLVFTCNLKIAIVFPKNGSLTNSLQTQIT